MDRLAIYDAAIEMLGIVKVTFRSAQELPYTHGHFIHVTGRKKNDPVPRKYTIAVSEGNKTLTTYEKHVTAETLGTAINMIREYDICPGARVSFNVR